MKGNILKQLRKEKGITQEELARDLGVARSLIGMVEANRQEGGRILATKVAKYFGVSLDYLEELTTDKKGLTNSKESLVTNFLEFLLNNNIIKDENNIDENTKELIFNMVREEIKNLKK